MYAALFRPLLPCAASLDRNLEQALTKSEIDPLPIPLIYIKNEAFHANI
jgi:hypothetical protein